MDEEMLVALITIDTPDRARQMAVTLVGEQLAGCVNIVPAIESIYRWEDRIQTDGECLLLAKTTPARLPSLIERVKNIHPYTLPEIIAVPVSAGSRDYFDWVRHQIRESPEVE